LKPSRSVPDRSHPHALDREDPCLGARLDERLEGDFRVLALAEVAHAM